MRKLFAGLIVSFFFLVVFFTTSSPTYAAATCRASLDPVPQGQLVTLILEGGPLNQDISFCLGGCGNDFDTCDKTSPTGYAVKNLNNSHRLSPGDYTFQVGTRPLLGCGISSLICSGTFSVGGVGPGFNIDRCQGEGVVTAIGCIPTDAAGFASFLLKYLLGIAAAIAFFLILAAGFQILTSSGNPEKLEGAKQLLTAAVVGLFFIVFAVVILQIIGVNILGGIPGFPTFQR